MLRLAPSRPLGCYRVLAGDTFVAGSDLLWHAQHHAELRLGRTLSWVRVPDPHFPEHAGAEANFGGVTVRAAWHPFNTGGHVAGPGHLGG